MNKTPNKDQIIGYLHTYAMAPIRRLGQNFLIDDKIAETIVKSTHFSIADKVCEIGPGFGALTNHLIDDCKDLTLVEIDVKMCQFLEKQYGRRNNVHVIHSDAMKVDLSSFDVIISNLPYYLTTALIEKSYKEGINLRQAVFMMQKDVWPRLVAKQGEPGYGPLAIILNHVASIKRIAEVKPHSFYPEPPVDSIVISIDFKQNIDRHHALKLDKVIRGLFINRRKTILNNLSRFVSNRDKALELLKQVNIDYNERPEQIEARALIDIANYLV